MNASRFTYILNNIRMYANYHSLCNLPESIEHIKNIDNSFEKSNITLQNDNIVVYRGTNKYVFGDERELAYLSTSESIDSAYKFMSSKSNCCMTVLYLSQGIKYINIECMGSRVVGEREILLQKGLYIKVLRKNEKKGIYHVGVSVEPYHIHSITNQMMNEQERKIMEVFRQKQKNKQPKMDLESVKANSIVDGLLANYNSLRLYLVDNKKDTENFRRILAYKKSLEHFIDTYNRYNKITVNCGTKKITEDEKESILFYTSKSFHCINSYLRGFTLTDTEISQFQEYFEKKQKRTEKPTFVILTNSDISFVMSINSDISKPLTAILSVQKIKGRFYFYTLNEVMNAIGTFKNKSEVYILSIPKNTPIIEKLKDNMIFVNRTYTIVDDYEYRNQEIYINMLSISKKEKVVEPQDSISFTKFTPNVVRLTKKIYSKIVRGKNKTKK